MHFYNFKLKLFRENIDKKNTCINEKKHINYDLGNNFIIFNYVISLIPNHNTDLCFGCVHFDHFVKVICTYAFEMRIFQFYLQLKIRKFFLLQ